MQRVLVIGNSGGGKSTLARALGDKLGLPVIHLDRLFWKPGWTETAPADFRALQTEALSAPAWICDGDFGSHFDLRMPLADTIIWMDQPPWLCLARVIWRAIRYRKGGRPDIAEGCHEKVDLAFYRYILTWNRARRPRLEDALRRYGSHARLIRVRSDREIAALLASA